MIFYYISFVLGVTLGYFSFRFEDIFLSACAAGLPILIVILSRAIGPMLILYKDVPSQMDGHAPGEHTVLSAIVDIIGQIQTPLLLIAVFAVFTRLGFWFFTLALTSDQTETRAQRKQRIHAMFQIEE